VTLWQTEVEAGTNRQGVQQQLAIPNLGSAPMVDPAVPSSRFAPPLVGLTENGRHQRNSRLLHLWQQEDLKRREQEALEQGSQLVLPVAMGSLGQPSDQPNH